MPGRTQASARPASAAPRKKTAARVVDAAAETQDMDPEMNGGGSAAIVRLGQVLDLNAAGSLAAELLALRGRSLEVDASAVQRMGAQCLQVLLSARATWDADGAAFALVSPSDEFASTVALLGAPIDQHFNTAELAA